MLTGWRDFDDTLRAFDQLQRRIDRTFDSWAAPSPAADRLRRRATASWPATNVFETKESFIVKAEVPGLAENDVSVSVEDDALVVRGERKCTAPEGYTAHLRERASVAFTRKLPLPARVDADGVAATLRDGVLTITLPKAKDALPRQVTVKAG
ncbi:MAG: Hsp20/alpha crystallin family protein [Polyangiaceae bacterium]